MCDSAREFLGAHAVVYEEVQLSGAPDDNPRLHALAPGAHVAPVFDIGGTVVLGFDRERVADLLRIELREADRGGTWTVPDQVEAEVASAAGELAKDLALARRVHASMIPADAEHAHLTAAVRFRPRIGVGGDYAALQRADAHRYYLSVADVTGHGIASALLVSRVHSWVLSRLASAPAPHELVRELNHFLYDQFDGVGLFLTFWIGLIDARAGTLQYSGAAHPASLLLRGVRPPIRLGSESPLLGVVRDGADHARSAEVTLEAGDLVVLYTDGITEARNAQREQFEEAGLLRALARHQGERVDAVADGILRAVSQHEPGPASDDRLVMVVRTRES